MLHEGHAKKSFLHWNVNIPWSPTFGVGIKLLFIRTALSLTGTELLLAVTELLSAGTALLYTISEFASASTELSFIRTELLFPEQIFLLSETKVSVS